MDAHRAPTVVIELVQGADGVQRGLNGLAGELISHDEHADALVIGPVAAQRLFHAGNGIGLAESAPVLGAGADFRALLRRIGQPFAARSGEHVLALVIDDLQTLDRGIQAQDLIDDRQVQVPVIAGHARGGVDDEEDVFAVDGNPADGSGRRPARPALQEALHLGRQRLIRGHQLSLDDVGDGRVLLAGGILSLDVREITRQARELLLVQIQRCDPAVQLSVELLGFPADQLQLHLQRADLSLEVRLALLELDRLTDFREHQQQDDGSEAAADAVQEREAEYLDVTAAAHYGQSFDGIMSVPSVSRERCQNRCAACVSPFMGNRIVSIGTWSGSCPTASSNSRMRAPEST